MSPLKLGVLTMLTYLTMAGRILASSGDPEEIVNDFCSVFNGIFVNTPSGQDGVEVDIIYTTMIPVSLPLITDKPAMYLEESDNGHINRMLILVISVGADGNLDITPYNFTDQTKYEPGTYNINDLLTVKPENLTTADGSTVHFELIRRNFFLGKWPNTRIDRVNGKHLVYEMTCSCDLFTVDMPTGAKEMVTTVPYKFYRLGHKFPLVNPPAKYVPPCNMTQ